jgi:signal transduction histidine kinase
LLTTAANTVVSVYVRKKDREELLFAKERAEESDRLKSAFLDNISHEIRTPMNSIFGFISLLQNPNLTNIERNEYIHIVKEGGERLLNTIRDIVDISEVEAKQVFVELSKIDINELVLTIISLYKSDAEAKGLTINNSALVSHDSAQVKTDKNKVYSILSNIIKNAIKYTSIGYIEIGVERNLSDIVLYVKDTGIGIPVEKQQVIFDRFVQVDSSKTRLYEGSGLGLSIAKAYVEMLGGKIWLNSELNKGSTFYIQIPVSD